MIFFKISASIEDLNSLSIYSIDDNATTLGFYKPNISLILTAFSIK
jgi:hypothetical protein